MWVGTSKLFYWMENFITEFFVLKKKIAALALSKLIPILHFVVFIDL